MAVNLDAERIWKVTCDRDHCGWRTYVSAFSEREAVQSAMEKFGCRETANGAFLCRRHGAGEAS